MAAIVVVCFYVLTMTTIIYVYLNRGIFVCFNKLLLVNTSSTLN